MCVIMRKRMYFCTLQILAIIFNIPYNQGGERRAIFIGILTKPINSTSRTTRLKVDGFKIQDDLGFQYKDGTITTDTSGLYFISCHVIISSVSDYESYTLAININQETLEMSTLQANSTVAKGLSTLQINGVFLAGIASTIEIFVITKVRTQMTVLETSRISIFLLSKDKYTQAISVQLIKGNHMMIARMDQAAVTPWKTGRAAGSVITTRLFQNSDGYLVIAENGYYIVAANGIFDCNKRKFCAHTVQIYRGNNVLLLSGTKTASPRQQKMTVNVVGVLRLNRNDRMWIRFRSTCKDAYVFHASTYSVSKIKIYSNATLECPKHQWYKFPTGWTNLMVGRPCYFVTPSLKTPDISLSNKKLGILLPKTGTVLLSVILKWKTSDNRTYMQLAISRNLEIANNQTDLSSDEILAMANGTERLGELSTLQMRTLVKVKRNDTLRIYINMPHHWLLFERSRIDFFYIEQNQNDSDNTQRIPTKQGEWTVINSCLGKETFLTDSQQRKILTVRNNGIYYVIISIEINMVDDNANDIEVALKSDDDRILLYGGETSVKLKKSINIASTLRLDYTQKLSLNLRTQKKNLGLSCSLQIEYLGYQDNVVGFQANLRQDFETKSLIGFFPITQYYNSSNPLKEEEVDKRTFYNTGGHFSYSTGEFNTPIDGTYMVSANVVVKKLRLLSDEDYIALRVMSNNLSTVYYTERKKHLNLNNRSFNRDSTVTLTVAGVLSLQRNDRVYLQVYVHSDINVLVDQRSSFSVTFIGSMTQTIGFVAYSQNPLTRLSDGNSYTDRNIDGWILPKGGAEKSSRYGSYVTTSPDSPSVTNNDGKIVFRKDGLYLVTFHVLLRQRESTNNIRLRFVRESDMTYRKCDSFINQYAVTGASCQFIHFFKKNDNYTFQIYKENGVSKEDFYGNESKSKNVNIAYVSVLFLNQPRNYQFVAANLQERQEFSLSSQVMKPWQQNNHITYTGDVGYDRTLGILRTRSKGWYLFTLHVACFREFGNATVTINRNSAANSILLEATGECNKQNLYLSIAGIVYLSKHEEITSKMYGYGPDYIESVITTFTAAQLPNRLDHDSYMKYTAISQSKFKDLPENSRPNIGRRISWQAYADAEQPTLQWIPRQIGVYLVIVNLIAVTSGPNVQLTINCEKEKEVVVYSGHYSTKNHQTLTMLLSGALVIKKVNRTLSVNVTGGTNVRPRSFLSVVFLRKDPYSHPVAVLNALEDKNFTQKGFSIHNLELIQMYKMNYENNMFIPEVTGVYMLSCNVILSTSRARYIKMDVLLDEELVASARLFIGKERNTMTLSSSMFIRRGSLLSIKLRRSLNDNEDNITISSGSSVSLVLIESPQSEPLSPLLPVITNTTTYKSIIDPTSRKMHCINFGRNQQYNWYFNNALLPNERSSTLHANFSLGYGIYQCQPLFHGLGPLSKAAHVNKLPPRTCSLNRRFHCKTREAKCIDKIGRYAGEFECHCIDKSRVFVDGKCIANHTSETDYPFLILILIPFLLITILIVLTCSIYIFIKRKRAKGLDSEREAFSIHQEGQDDLITMRSLNTSMNDETDGSETPSQGAVGMTPRLSSSDIVDKAMLLHHNEIVQRRDRRTYSTRSYTPTVLSGYEDTEDDGANFSEHRWKKLMNASTKV